MVGNMYIMIITRFYKRSCTSINTLNNEGVEKRNYNLNIYRGLKLWITYFFIFIGAFNMQAQNSFLKKQMSYTRVKEAFNLKEQNLIKEFKEKNIIWPPSDIYIRSFKAELVLELWVGEGNGFKLFKTYTVCQGSGTIGPKIKEGDRQVPEGLYLIDRFNPVSAFWLSLGINYPNKVDLLRSMNKNPGGDIFIHGNCVSSGCLPMTDDIMNEIYIIAVLARNQGQENIPVHIYPYRFSVINNNIHNYNGGNNELWRKLEAHYIYFNKNKKLQDYYISATGNYIFLN